MVVTCILLNNRIPLKPVLDVGFGGGAEGAYAASQTTLLHMKRRFRFFFFFFLFFWCFYTPSHNSGGVLWFHVGRQCVCPSVRPLFVSG